MKTLWLKNPEKHDFPTAIDYLELLFPPLKARLEYMGCKLDDFS